MDETKVARKIRGIFVREIQDPVELQREQDRRKKMKKVLE